MPTDSIPLLRPRGRSELDRHLRDPKPEGAIQTFCDRLSCLAASNHTEPIRDRQSSCVRMRMHRHSVFHLSSKTRGGAP